MIQEYTKEQFNEDKKEYIKWLEKNWKYGDVYFGNILRQLRYMKNELEQKEE